MLSYQFKFSILFILFFIYGFSFSADKVKILAPLNALQILKEGNTRFVQSERNYTNQTKERRELTAQYGQKPYAVILGCSDSRTPVEHIFDAGIGDLFVIRVAGNVADTDEIGSVEYGAEYLNIPLIVVMGNSSCELVSAVIKNKKIDGNLKGIRLKK